MLEVITPVIPQKGKRITDIVPKLPQYEDAEYAGDLNCPCGKSGFHAWGIEKPVLLGWAETNYGYQGIFECPVCGGKFRFHCACPAADLDEFDNLLEMYAEKCANWPEIEKKLN